MTTSKKETQDIVRRMKHNEKQLTLEIEKMNSKLIGNLSGIDQSLRKMQSNFLEVEPYYLRRRCSVEPASDNDQQAIDSFRNRSRSFGTIDTLSTNGRWLEVRRGSSQCISRTDSKESISSNGSSRSRGQSPSRGNSKRRDSSPCHNLHLGIPTCTINANSSDGLQFYRSNDRNLSLPVGTNGQMRENNRSKNDQAREVSPDTDNCFLLLRRVKMELNHRTPKTVRQLKQTNKTSTQERQEIAKMEEEYLKENAKSEIDIYEELEDCTYIRRPYKDTELTIEEIFGHSVEKENNCGLEDKSKGNSDSSD